MSATLKKHIRKILKISLSILILGCFFLLLQGCAGVSSTTDHYVAMTLEKYPPKPKEQEIPLLGKNPDCPWKLIGRFEWETYRNWRFILRSLEYNARLNGADAIVLRKKKIFHETTLTDVPPTIEMMPITRYEYVQTGPNNNRRVVMVPVETYVPIYVPGYVNENIIAWTRVEADMIVFTNSKKQKKQPPTAN